MIAFIMVQNGIDQSEHCWNRGLQLSGIDVCGCLSVFTRRWQKKTLGQQWP